MEGGPPIWSWPTCACQRGSGSGYVACCALLISFLCVLRGWGWGGRSRGWGEARVVVSYMMSQVLEEVSYFLV